MSVRLDDTTASAVETAISAERFRQGSSAVGRGASFRITSTSRAR